MSPSDGADTELARLLQASGRLPADQLGPLLERIRFERRTNPHASLGALLLAAGFVTRAELDSLGQRPQAQLPQPTPWRAGEQVAGYRLEEPLGRGGAGVVFRATHLATGRAVALKGLHSADPHAAERFMREAQAQAQADGHPHVGRVHDAGLASGRPYLAMELLTGGDLLDRLKRGAYSAPREAAELVAKLARGLAHVHARGILHRDVKPENVLFDAAGEPKLVDFGVAYLIHADTLTQTGQLLGTPEYMAPEQALGLTQVDVRADVYGLGAILYTCLTGRPPFVGQLGEVVAQVLADDPPRPSGLRPGLDPRVEAICLEALAKRPEDRLPDAPSLAAALEAWLAPSSPAAAPAAAAPATSPVIVVAVAVACLALGLAAGAWAARRGAEPQAAEVSPPAPVDPPAAVVAPAEPPVDPAPPVEPALEARAPRTLRASDLAPGVCVMVPVTGSRPDKPDWRLGSVLSLRGEGDAREVLLLVDDEEVGPLSVPRAGFRADALGPGARALDRYEGGASPCTVIERRGPLALVEFEDRARAWRSALRLTLCGEGADAGDLAAAEIVLAPWGKRHRYPALVLQGVRRDDDRVRVLYLDEDAFWADPRLLRPLPTSGDAVEISGGERDGEQVVILERLGPWVLEVATSDGTRERLGLDRIRVPLR